MPRAEPDCDPGGHSVRAITRRNASRRATSLPRGDRDAQRHRHVRYRRRDGNDHEPPPSSVHLRHGFVHNRVFDRDDGHQIAGEIRRMVFTDRSEHRRMISAIAADPMLERVLDGMNRFGHPGGPNRHRLYAAQIKTDWGKRCQRLFALTEGQELLASAAQYDLTGALDGAQVRICGIGSVVTYGPWLDRGRHLVDALLDQAARGGAQMGLVFWHTDADKEVDADVQVIRFIETTIDVAQSPRHGAPMTTIRGGESRDLPAIVAMGRVRAKRFRFHFDRDVDFVQYAITTQRLLAGLGAPNARHLQFFIAEEGITAAAYVVISAVGDTWTLEECGDRDPSGARVGALLQALIAREPAARRPTIRAQLPSGFVPPQVAAMSSKPSGNMVTVRILDRRRSVMPLSVDDVLFWHDDLLDPST